MGVTLTLGFMSHPHVFDLDELDEEGRIVADRLDFVGKHYELWAKIHDLEPRPVPWPVEWWGSNWSYHSGPSLTREDIRGGPLTYVRAGELAPLDDGLPMGPYDRAIFCFLKALPPETVVTLWWG